LVVLVDPVEPVAWAVWVVLADPVVLVAWAVWVAPAALAVPVV
jgi:hypothetical protein